MSIKGSKGYCEYCRAGEETKQLSLDKRSGKLICIECLEIINRHKVLLSTMEKRLTPMLEKYLVNTCFERTRTSPEDERYKENILFVAKNKKNISGILTKNMTKIFEKSRILAKNTFTSQTYYFGISETDLFVIRAQRENKSNNYKVSIIGRVELSEILEILR